MMQKLNLPETNFKVKKTGGKVQIFDVIRKKYVALTPEECVRQNFSNYLVSNLMYPAGLIAVEMLVKVNGLSQRAEIVVYSKKGKPVIIVECKAPGVSVTKTVFNQAARYNSKLDAGYLIVTNGIEHFCAKLIDSNGNYEIMNVIPDYNDINQ